jgi:uncharacterized coiled-coil protein SlyX
LINKFANDKSGVNDKSFQNKVDELSLIVQELTMENNQLKDKVKYLEDKMRQLIVEQIQFKKTCSAQQN